MEKESASMQQAHTDDDKVSENSRKSIQMEPGKSRNYIMMLEGYIHMHVCHGRRRRRRGRPVGCNIKG